MEQLSQDQVQRLREVAEFMRADAHLTIARAERMLAYDAERRVRIAELRGHVRRTRRYSSPNSRIQHAGQ